MGTTQIVLPFNHMERLPCYVETHVDREKAFNNISERLQNLDITTLLFTRNVFEIKWIIQGKEGSLKQGHYLREDTLKNNIDGNDFRKTKVTDGDSLHTYLIYSRPIKWEGREHKPVDIAFYLNTHGEKEFIQSSKNKLFVLFPTTCETFMGFLMNGPFRTPAHRETVSKEDDFNQFLILQIGKLLRQSMFDLKGKGLLSVSFLNVLPIRTEDFPKDSMFYPIYVAVRDALINEDLLPADDGTFVSARNAKLARRAELRSLLNQDQLSSLFQSTVSLFSLIDAIKWLPGEITQGRSPDLRLYLLEHLKIEEVRPEKFVELLTDDFLENQSDQWIIDFYSFVKDRTEFWKKPDAALKKRKIIRLEDNSHVIPLKSDRTPNAYLPSSTTSNFPTIKRSIFEDETAAEFLNNLGILEPDAFAEIIESILPKYAEDGIKVGKEENIGDLRKIKKLLDEPFRGNLSNSLSKLRILSRKAPQLAGLLARIENLPGNEDKNGEFIRSCIPVFFEHVLPSIPLLRASNGRETEYKCAEDIYKNASELHHYFQGNSEAWFICDDYPDEILSLLDELRINGQPKVTKKSPDTNGFVIISKSHSYHRRGIKGFDPDIKVDGLEYAINHPSIEKSLFIWNRIAIPNKNCIRGVVESSSRKTYENSKNNEQISQQFGQLLMQNDWLPDKQGDFYKPSELEHDDLPDSFVWDEKLAEQIEMKKDVVAKLAEEANISQDTIKIAKELEMHPELLEEFRKKLQPIAPDDESTATETVLDKIDYKDKLINSFNQPRKTELQESTTGEGKVINHGRRARKIQEGIEEDKANEPSPEERFNKIPKKVWEGKNYDARIFIQEQYNGKCQICGQTFIKRNGQPYFEGLYLVSRTNARWIDRAGNILCLCANHSAQLQHGSVEAGDIIEKIKSFIIENDEERNPPMLRIKLCGKECKITYTEKHLLDLQELLRASESQK